MKALVIGASGQVGSHLVQELTKLGRDFFATHYRYPRHNTSKLDITNYTEVSSFIEENKPDIIYLPAASPNVDHCEIYPNQTYPINVTGVAHVVKAANVVGAKVVYFSSDYIFDGKSGPYSEEVAVNPICEYGRQKVYAEHYLTTFCKEYLIIRTTVVYGWEDQKKNFIIRLLNSLRENISIQVPIDQIGSPTYAPNLASACVFLAEHEASGIYHVTGTELISRYEFALEAARVFGLQEKLIQPTSTESLAQTARRPLNLGLIVNKAANLLPFSLVGYKEGLQKLKREQP